MVAQLPFDDASFEVVLCQQRLQFFSDRTAAMKEMVRVADARWQNFPQRMGTLERCVFHSALVKAVGSFLGSDAVSAFEMAFSLNTSEELHDLAAEASFKSIMVTNQHRAIRHRNVDDYADGFIQATPMAAKYLELPDCEKQRFGEQVTALLSGYMADHGLASPMENHYLLATR